MLSNIMPSSKYLSAKEQAFSQKNIRLFLWFRVFFNCRYYYPILAIFFLDLGLSLSQFVILNVIWAASIVIFEIPSGALADLVGRKKLIILSASLYSVEMLLLLIAPRDPLWLLFSICALNRLLAGVAEAAASGADEALAYDSLQGANKNFQWDEVLASLGKRMAAGMAVALAVGSIIYDEEIFLWLHEVLGTPLIERHFTIKLPIFLCFIQSLLAVITACKLKDSISVFEKNSSKLKLSQITKTTLKATKWVITTKAVALLVIGTMLIDVSTRNIATLTSVYYKFIGLPEYIYGLIGASIALLGFLVPLYAKPLAQKYSYIANIFIVSTTAVIGLFGLSQSTSAWGIIPVILVMFSFKHTLFIASRFLNQFTEESIRATVLSVKGLIHNLGYALFSLFFAYGLKRFNTVTDSSTSFQKILFWSPSGLVLLLSIFFITSYFITRSNRRLADNS